MTTLVVWEKKALDNLLSSWVITAFHSNFTKGGLNVLQQLHVSYYYWILLRWLHLCDSQLQPQSRTIQNFVNNYVAVHVSKYTAEHHVTAFRVNYG